MDWLTNLYLGCFIFGLIFTVASFLLGGLDHFSLGGHDLSLHTHTGGHDLNLHTHTGGPGHGDVGHAHSHASHDQGDKETLGWFNFNALVVFLTWFGGAGFIFQTVRVGDWLSVVLAIASGILGYTLVMLFLTKVLLPSQTQPMREEDYNLTGTVARVSSTIFENGVGAVMFSKHGTRRSVPARSVDGQPFSRDSQVVILSFDKGVAMVDDLNRLLAEAGAEKWVSPQLEESTRNIQEL